jgi:hypothetical protein
MSSSLSLEFPLANRPETIHPRDSHITFDEPSHSYFIDNTRKVTISTTPLAAGCFDHFDPDKALVSVKNSIAWKNKTHALYGKSDDEIKTIWNSASGLGTTFHSMCEFFYTKHEIPNPTEPHEIKEWLQFKDFHFSHIVPKGYEPYRSEWRVFTDESLDIAGSIDMVFKNPKTNKYLIYDWKRVKELKKEAFRNKKGIWPIEHMPDTNMYHYFLQLNIYRYILQKYYDIPIEGMALVCCHSDRHTYEVQPVPVLEEEIESILRVRKLLIQKNIFTFTHDDILSLKN